MCRHNARIRVNRRDFRVAGFEGAGAVGRSRIEFHRDLAAVPCAQFHRLAGESDCGRLCVDRHLAGGLHAVVGLGRDRHRARLHADQLAVHDLHVSRVRAAQGDARRCPFVDRAGQQAVRLAHHQLHRSVAQRQRRRGLLDLHAASRRHAVVCRDDHIRAARANRGDCARRGVHRKHAFIVGCVCKAAQRSLRIHACDLSAALAQAQHDFLPLRTDRLGGREHRHRAGSALTLLGNAGENRRTRRMRGYDAADRIDAGHGLIAGGEAVLTVGTGRIESDLGRCGHANTQRHRLTGERDRSRVLVDSDLHSAHKAIVRCDGDCCGARAHAGDLARRIHLHIAGVAGFELEFRVAVAGDFNQAEHIEALVQAELVAAGGEHEVFLRRCREHLQRAAVAHAGVDRGRRDGCAAQRIRANQAAGSDAGHGFIAGSKDALLAVKFRQHDAQLALHAGTQRKAVLRDVHFRCRAIHAHRGLGRLAGQIVRIDVNRDLSPGHARHGSIRRNRCDGRIAALEGATSAVAAAGKLRGDLRVSADEDLGAGGRGADGRGCGFHRHLAGHAAEFSGGRDGRGAGAHACEPAGARVNGHIFGCRGCRLHRAGRTIHVDGLAIAEQHAQRHALVAHADGGAGLAHGHRHRLHGQIVCDGLIRRGLIRCDGRLGISARDDAQREIIVVGVAAHAVHLHAGLPIAVHLAALLGIHRARVIRVDPADLDVRVRIHVECNLQPIRPAGILRGAGEHVDHALANPCDDFVRCGIALVDLGIVRKHLSKASHKCGASGGLVCVVNGVLLCRLIHRSFVRRLHGRLRGRLGTGLRGRLRSGFLARRGRGLFRGLRRGFRRGFAAGRRRGQIGFAALHVGRRALLRFTGGLRLRVRSGFLHRTLLLGVFPGIGLRQVFRDQRHKQCKARQDRQHAKQFLHIFPPFQAAEHALLG